MSYYAAGQYGHTDGWRDVKHEQTERFGEIMLGYQPSDDTQLVFWGTAFNSQSDLPGAVTGLPGDVDDRQHFQGYDAVVAVRQRLSDEAGVTGKYSYRRGLYGFQNPDSMTGADTNPFRRLVNGETQHSAEVRLDVNSDDGLALRAGYAHVRTDRSRSGAAGAVDPNTNQVVFTPFQNQATPRTDTAWAEVEKQLCDDLQLTVGAYWGRETGSTAVAQPKIVAVYRPDGKTWISALAIPIIRADGAELAPVEALADPAGLGYLDFVEGGAGRSYEFRCQRQTGSSGNITTSVAYQRVRGLLIDVEDPTTAGLPARVLANSGHRWVADASYEQWLGDKFTGRVWGRWQDSRGTFTQAGVAGTEWPYAPTWQAGGRVDFIDDNGIRLGLEGVWIDDRFHDAANAQVVGDYVVFNLRARYQRDLHQSFFLDVSNLTDRDYVSYAGYPQSGIAVMGGVEYRF